MMLMAAAVAVLWGSSVSAYQTVTLDADIQQRAIRATDRMVHELTPGGLGSLSGVPSAPFWSAELTVDRVSGVESDGRVTWETIRIHFEYDEGEADDGKDNNGNGLVDEGRVVLTREVGTARERRVILSRFVPEHLTGEEANGKDDNGNGLIDERGLCFSLENGVLRVLLSLEVRRPGGELETRIVETGVSFRND